MGKRESEPLTKHLIHLYQGDFEKIGKLYEGVSAAKLIRLLVRRTIKRIEDRAAATSPHPALGSMANEMELTDNDLANLASDEAQPASGGGQ